MQEAKTPLVRRLAEKLREAAVVNRELMVLEDAETALRMGQPSDVAWFELAKFTPQRTSRLDHWLTQMAHAGYLDK
jgi:hypothetical protein